MQKAKKNILTMLVSQLVATVCGVVIPRVIIGTYGSAMYGLTASIAQFLSYISLLEGGVCRVARAELYVPLAQKDNREIGRVYQAIKHFFLIVGVVFLVYTLVLSVSYYDIAQTQETDRLYVFFLVWIISAGTLAKYLGGLSNLTLLNADQKQYVGNIIVTAATVANALLVVVLAKTGCDLLWVKIGSSLAYIAQPVCYWLYVKKHYQIPDMGKQRAQLKQKWTGIGQHIAYFLHTNVDVVILTIFADLRWVAVYSVYRLVISSIRKITSSFTNGMEAVFGELLANNKIPVLQRVFMKYKYMLSFAAAVLFGTTAVLVVPFVRLYTQGITDVNYIQPAFAVVLLLAEAIDCFIHPCASLPVSANKLKETKWGAYGEAGINIVLSLILVHWDPLLGIALATLIATVFKALFYMTYGAKNILRMKLSALLKNFLLTNAMIGVCAAAGCFLIKENAIQNYVQWGFWGVAVFCAVFLTTAVVYFIFYPQITADLLASCKRKSGSLIKCSRRRSNEKNTDRQQ